MKLFKLINEEVEQMLKESIDTKNFTCKIKKLGERLFTYEGLELLMNLNNTIDKNGNMLKSKYLYYQGSILL